MAKKKKKWKKRLGKALLAGAALAGGLALAKRRNRAASIADNEAKEAGFGAMRLKDYGPHTIGNYHQPKKKWISTNPLANKNWNKMDTSEVNMDYVAPSTERYNKPDFGMSSTFSGAMAKKGGRIVKTKGGGKAVRGLGRAFTKGKK